MATRRWPDSPFHLISGDDRTKLFFHSIVNKNTRDVAIGPLEYCGTGRIVTDKHKKKMYVT